MAEGSESLIPVSHGSQGSIIPMLEPVPSVSEGSRPTHCITPYVASWGSPSRHTGVEHAWGLQ